MLSSRTSHDRRPVPELDGPILVARGDPAAVGTEGHAPHEAGVAPQGDQLLAAVRVPDLDGPVHARGGDPVARAIDRQAAGDELVPLEDLEGAPARGVPDAEVPVGAGRDDS